jgi:hypothetical protein
MDNQLLKHLYLGIFSRAEQRVLQAIFKAIGDGGGQCVATLTALARNSNTSKATTRNAITRAVAIGLLQKTAPLLLRYLASQHSGLRKTRQASRARRLQCQHRSEPSALSASTYNQAIFDSSNESHGSGYRPQSPHLNCAMRGPLEPAWQQRTNVWREVTSPAHALRSIRTAIRSKEGNYARTRILSVFGP